jgi:outer membrane protein assembly factor BamD (BamD/ComL family)
MKKYLYFALVLIIAVLSGCKPSREKSVVTINSLETRLFSPNTAGFDKVKADSLLAAYESFMSRFPEDSLTIKFTFKAANLAMTVGDAAKSVALFDKFMEKYPDHPKARVSMFFKAYIYENQIKNLDKAKEVYLQFIEKYPTGDFSSDARLALKNLGKSPEQMMQEFEEQRKVDSLRVADSLLALKKGKPSRKK